MQGNASRKPQIRYLPERHAIATPGYSRSFPLKKIIGRRRRLSLLLVPVNSSSVVHSGRFRPFLDAVIADEILTTE